MGIKRSTKAIQWWIGGALCVVAFGKLLIQLDSASQPDPSTCHIEPMLFAPTVSTSWSYATQWQVVLLAVAMVCVLLMVLAWGLIELRNRLTAWDGDAADDQTSLVSTQDAPSAAPSGGSRRRPFGRAGLKLRATS